jgi:chromosome segregation ATPase
LVACQSDGADEAESAATDDPHEGVPGAPADLDTEAMQRQMALMTELQALDQVLAPVREQAMQDPDIQARERDLIQQVDAAMESITPGILEVRARFDSLRAEYGVAQQAGDQERVQTLGGELQILQGSIQETQGQALEQEGVASAIEELREDLFTRMRAIDGGADSLLNRAEALMEELQVMAEEAESGN